MLTKVGIVIVSYNASLAVRATLASLKQAKNNTPYEMLLIDNASSAEERKTIYKAFEKHTSGNALPWKYVQLDKNLGFAGGNNYGIKAFLKDADITHVCLLNSDVIVTDYWIDRLVEKGYDALSSVTNKADSEQCIPITYQLELPDCIDVINESTPAAAFKVINDFAQERYQAWKGNDIKTDVTFFCVLLSRKLIEKVGLLDETFFPGGYEDDDYCVRIKNAGFDIYLARDVFMHHFGSASFGQLKEQYFAEKASKNKQYLEQKHNIKCKRRPEKPVDSFAQDIVYALSGKGTWLLQSAAFPLYIQTVASIINHYQNEFTAIHNHLVHSGHQPSKDIEQLVATAVNSGNITDGWNDVLEDIQAAALHVPANVATLNAIEKKLAFIASAVYAKAEANIEMHNFLCSKNVFSSEVAVSKKSRGQKIKWALKKGLPLLWNLRGIVFFGGYPYPEREKDGYFQRIRSIDNLFKDRWRIYVDHMPVQGKDVWYDKPEPNVVVFHINNHRHRWFMRLLVGLAVLRCRTIYYHSVLRMNDSNFGDFMRWPFLKKVIDIHGVVPEEFRMHNDFFSASIYDAHEKLAIEKADHVIVVTEAMHRYLQQKYREVLSRTNVIVLPIFPEVTASSNYNKPYTNGMSVVVYAGGTHKWQQVPKMLDAIIATNKFCTHKFFCPNPAEVIAMLPEQLQEHPPFLIATRSYSDLLKEYELCHYGFILRQDNVVNHVACPTKLVEYITMGIVPIVDSEEMGDFNALGMQFVCVKDFIEGKIPGEKARNEMAEINQAIYKKLQHINLTGKNILQNALSVNEKSKTRSGIERIKETGKNAAVKLLPKESRRGQVVRKIWHKAKGTKNEFEEVLEIAPPQIDLSAISECDVLVQVDNFLVGGLENVVLDLNETLIKAGLKVNMLVLAEAGAAVERARQKGMNVLVTSYHEENYEKIIAAAKPKLVITHYSISGAAICAKFQIPFIQVIHNTYMWFTYEQAEQFKNAAKHTTAFIAVSEYVKEYSVARLGVQEKKCFVIPNGIDLYRFRNENIKEQAQEVKEKLGLTKDDFVFLNVGSITHQKNHISTVKAFHMALQDCKNAKLVILGKMYEVQLWKEIEEYIAAHDLSSHIIYAGESDNPPAFYQMADAFIHSAFFEGGQLSILEAVAANLSIVTTNIGFAKHFKNVQGIKIVPPPVEIIKYTGHIWELKPSAVCERNLAVKMVQAYNERQRPDLNDNVVELMDMQHTYKHYIKLVNGLLENGNVSLAGIAASWPDVVEGKAAKTFSTFA